jgi:protein TonB
LALGVSAAVHVAVFAAPLGLTSSSPVVAPVPALLEVEVEVEPVVPPVPPVPPEDVPLPNRVALAPAAPASPAPTPRAAPSPAVTTTPSSTVAPTLLVADAPLPHFTIAITATSPEGQEPARGKASGRASPVDDDVPFSERAVDTPARLVRGEVPSYPAEARGDGVEADVPLQLVVSREGGVESVHVVRRAGHGFDEAAIGSAHRFRFSPALKQGQPVRVLVSWTVEFRLQ